jgi:ppGpp synthetase/RelA/SpoT-type nucleotidyltranferase
MPDKPALTPEIHKRQIDAYTQVRPQYATYADALKRVLERACQVSFPEAFVQARAKTVSSFAEKAARKFDKYPDAVNQMTDLCGARVIVQTAEQVRAVRSFIEANFEILESEDKGLLLSKDEFGYRDMHYIVRLLPDRAGALGFNLDEQTAISAKRAEIQVRTWLQHAWADTLHDRMYKNKLKLSADITRTGALLAALMEEGDRNFNVLADDLDGLIANYTAVASKADVEKEIAIQQLILDNEIKAEKKPGLALKLARLAAASGDHQRVVKILAPWVEVRDANRCELLLELGHSLCSVHRERPSSDEYLQGKGYLDEAARLCACEELASVPNLRKRESLHARALARLGWAVAAIPGEEHEARACFRQAHEHEPANPYYLSAMLGFELHFGNQGGLPASMATTIREAVRTCLAHAAAGIELPFAFFTAGRLSLLLEQRGQCAGLLRARHQPLPQGCVLRPGRYSERAGGLGPWHSFRREAAAGIAARHRPAGSGPRCGSRRAPRGQHSFRTTGVDCRRRRRQPEIHIARTDPPAAQGGVRAVPRNHRFRRHHRGRAGMHRRRGRGTGRRGRKAVPAHRVPAREASRRSIGPRAL